MSVHMIVGVTVGSEKIIKSIRRRGHNNILISDQYHEGAPTKYGDVIHLTPDDAIELRKKHPKGIIFHFYKNPRGHANIDHYEFGDS